MTVRSPAIVGKRRASIRRRSSRSSSGLPDVSWSTRQLEVRARRHARGRPGRRCAPRARASPRGRRSRCGSGAGSSGRRSRRASARARSGSGPHSLLHLPQPPVAVDVGQRGHGERRSRRATTSTTTAVNSQPMTAMSYISRIFRYRARSGSDFTTTAASGDQQQRRRTRRRITHALLSSFGDAQLGEHLEHGVDGPVDRGGHRAATGRCPRRSPRAGSRRRGPGPPDRPGDASMPSTTAGFIEWASMAGAGPSSAAPVGRRPARAR